jgi:hypothetical protein
VIILIAFMFKQNPVCTSFPVLLSIPDATLTISYLYVLQKDKTIISRAFKNPWITGRTIIQQEK